MTNEYDATAWYWVAGNRPGEVFTSAAPGWVLPGNPDYEAWLADGGRATNVLTDGELADVLLRAGLPGAVIAACGARDFGPTISIDEKRAIVAAIGCRLLGVKGAEGTYELAGQAWQDLRDEAQYAQTYGAFSGGAKKLTWPTREGTVTIANTADLLRVARALADYLTGWARYLSGNGPAPAALGAVTVA